MTSNQALIHPRVLLFDIGGVCVVSPFQAILDYEKNNQIPIGWVNYAISAGSPNGAFQRLERGEVLLDESFFRDFQADLTNETYWRQFWAKKVAASSTRERSGESASSEAAHDVPPPPKLDATWLYWEMMRISRAPDPHIFPALQRLRQYADASQGRLIIGALSNTSIFPPGHPYRDESTPDGRFHKHLKSMFDVFISSAHVGMRKPADDIYRYAVTRLHEYVKHNEFGFGVRPSDITFLDDIGSNLRTAKRLGMNTIKVQLSNTEKAVEELERLTGLKLKGPIDKARF